MKIRQIPTSNQETYVLSYLERNPQGATTLDFQQQGISAPAAVIARLRQRGYKIISPRETVVDGFGIPHRGMSRYKLIKGGTIDE